MGNSINCLLPLSEGEGIVKYDAIQNDLFFEQSQSTLRIPIKTTKHSDTKTAGAAADGPFKLIALANFPPHARSMATRNTPSRVFARF